MNLMTRYGPDRYVTKDLANNDYSQLSVVGMNETSRRTGHDYITLFVDLLKRQAIFIAEGKDHKTVNAFVDDVKAHNGDPDNIVDVSCDMSPAFIKGVNKYLPEAEITFDRFHIMKIINKLSDLVSGMSYQLLFTILSIFNLSLLLHASDFSELPFHQRSIQTVSFQHGISDIFCCLSFSIFEVTEQFLLYFSQE
jgi:Transposase and inactivated derivatives